MRKTITIILFLAAAFLALFSCNGSFIDPYVTNMRDGGFGTNPKDGKNPNDDGNPIDVNPADEEYTIRIDLFDNVTGDTLTASPNKGVAGVTVKLTYTVAKMVHYNQLDFGGVTAAIAPVESAGSGTRTYTINAADASNGVITITAVFNHTDLEIDHITFIEQDGGHITKTYGDAPFTNAITTAYKGDAGSNSIGTAQSNVFGSFSTTIWNISGNLNSSALPTLKDNPQSPAPTLPASS
jgi:hypothetical protein